MTRIAIIGAGAFAQVHLDILSRLPRVELAWICDANAEVARTAAERYGAANWTTDYSDALADAAVDAVDIVTPNHLHMSIAIAAAEAGKHVICEKPLALTVEEGTRMATAAATNGVSLMAKYHQRFDPVHSVLADLVGEAPEAFRVGMSRRVSNHLGTLLDKGHWRGNPALTGGGLLFSSGSHTLDVLATVFGPVSAVTAVTRQLVADDPGKADDNATVVLEHVRGAMSTFTGCWTAKQDSNTVIDAISTDQTLRAVTDADDLVLLRITSSGTEELLRSANWFVESNRRALEALTDSIAGDAEVSYTIDDILASMSVLEAAYRSSREGHRIPVNAAPQ